jgi:fatty acid desaturase
MGEPRVARMEWPTLTMLAACYAVWGLATTWGAVLWLPLGIAGTGLAVALHSSLCHEALHGHPTRAPWLNEALVWPALGLVVPYGRFRDTHLAHHRDEHLTDPYDDPETNYIDPAVWARRRVCWRAVLRANNTLLGRMVLGPWIGLGRFLRDDLALIRRGDRAVRNAWLRHVPAAALVLAWVVASPMPLWAYGLAVWIGMALLKIRTFLEHRAHERASARTVIIEDRGPLAWLFLNNNLHVVHHIHPGLPWYRLPARYAARRAHYMRRNGGYRFGSYWEIFRDHLWRAKDPVPHPLRLRG